MKDIFEEWITRGEAANALELDARTLTRWAAQGKGPKFAHFGKRPMYRAASLREWALAQEREPVREVDKPVTRRGRPRKAAQTVSAL
jgi:hypothetical protein